MLTHKTTAGGMYMRLSFSKKNGKLQVKYSQDKCSHGNNHSSIIPVFMIENILIKNHFYKSTKS